MLIFLGRTSLILFHQQREFLYLRIHSLLVSSLLLCSLWSAMLLRLESLHSFIIFRLLKQLPPIARHTWQPHLGTVQGANKFTAWPWFGRFQPSAIGGGWNTPHTHCGQMWFIAPCSASHFHKFHLGTLQLCQSPLVHSNLLRWNVRVSILTELYHILVYYRRRC